MMTNLYPIVFITLLGVIVLDACKKEDKEAQGVDKDLYDMAKVTTGFTWYKYSNALLPKSSGSGHPQAFLRTRYNTIAAAVLDSSGKIVSGTSFPDGSLIVKELYSDASTLARYAILYKKPGSENADSKGWVWGYIDANGDVAEASSKKGSACISCHSQSDNIDYMLMQKYFP